jgi:hypothetical protein
VFLIASFYLIQCNYSKENPGSSVPGRSNYPGGMSSMSIVKVNPALCTQHGVLAQSQAWGALGALGLQEFRAQGPEPAVGISFARN